MRTVSFLVLQVFGYESPYYKVLLQAESGNRYFVWYYNPINAELRQEILVDIDSDDWKRINNPNNGQGSDISRVTKIN